MHEGFLCPTSADVYGIDFLAFALQNYNSKEIIFQFGSEKGIENDFLATMHQSPVEEFNIHEENEEAVEEINIEVDAARTIDYTLPEEVLRAPVLLTKLTFRCKKALSNFRIIERHYFRSSLIKNYDFTFDFCIPGSVNCWETLYEVPPLTEECIADMIANPFKATSDTFYFVEDKLVMQNKARYQYIPKG